MSLNLLEKGYEPQDVEKRWYDFWEKEQLFAADEESDQKSYSIVIPPPNVTGVLHMGHALNITLQDILCRYRRLRGDNVLWMPGTDHAGIATQNVVERKLAAEGLSRHKFGRDKFIKAVWEWRKEYGSAIINQLKSLGASCDWKRERFTMDEGLSRSVRKVFVTLFNEGLIYRGNYMINWCPRCNTALADLEVEHDDHNGHLYYIRYPFAKGSGSIVIATTRPETMLGDTALAVNPDDERYKNIGSDHVILPLVNKEIPIIKDSYVDMSFGTGGLKVTPAHDPNDFEIGLRHNLQTVKVIGDDGVMTSEAGRFEGLDRFKCRDAVIKALKKEGYLEKIERYNHSVGHCYRCKTVVEPNLSEQWFIKTKPLAEKAIKAVEKGETKIIPSVWNKTYFDWMHNIKDWCISRQIWWGHQIPAWTCEKCGELVVAIDTPESCPACNGHDLVQDDDVLDTWFSSALWPFSTMGWPDKTILLDKFYPTSALVTGFDILFFWIARMMMMGIHFMGEAPFKDVYVHALVRDEDGKKMSKSKGNVIDPLSVIEKYGTDAFRFTLAAFAAQGRDIKMSEKRVEGYRNFINKLWNAARFALMHVTEENSKPNSLQPSASSLSLADRWILSRLNSVTKSVSDDLDSYRFNDAAGALYKFVWHEFCDWYLESIKPCLYGKEGEDRRQSTTGVLWFVLRNTLILLHPFTPFVTEEIWHKLPGTDGSIMKTVFPLDSHDDACCFHDEEAESTMELITGIISGIRNVRGEMNIPPSSLLDVSIQSQDTTTREIIKQHQDIVVNLAGLKNLAVEQTGEKPKASATAIVGDAAIFVSLEGIIDFAKETKRLEKEIGKLSVELSALSKKLNNEDFLHKAPEAIVEKVKEKHRIILDKQEKLEANLDKIRELGD
ncbi:MAG: valine--tRNA ligase [Deltaproteobacteria bacterium]|nr:valine--tRNA ligase [Deltaproteobacteria bacterium]MBW2661685.1 valine--tRNA ligase [Deltaproteobacteria bacterium]